MKMMSGLVLDRIFGGLRRFYIEIMGLENILEHVSCRFGVINDQSGFAQRFALFSASRAVAWPLVVQRMLQRLCHDWRKRADRILGSDAKRENGG
jgi:hypothetical protein